MPWRGAEAAGLSQPSPAEPSPPCPSSPGFPNPIISIYPPSSTVQQGQDASFKCLVREGAAPIKFEWKFRNQELEGELGGVGGAGGRYLCVVITPVGGQRLRTAPNSLCDPAKALPFWGLWTGPGVCKDSSLCHL